MACTDDVEIYAAKQQSVVRSWTHLIVRAIEGRKTDAPTGHVGDGAQGDHIRLRRGPESRRPDRIRVSSSGVSVTRACPVHNDSPLRSVGVRHSEGQLIKVANPRVASSAE
ncbi:hypothetical protein E4U15_004310 [Claviceps sp. LM218 group G6]|nr:hypothetical protein E4U15_004310 [Claviceps sp. LM218 group G6]